MGAARSSRTPQMLGGDGEGHPPNLRGCWGGERPHLGGVLIATRRE